MSKKSLKKQDGHSNDKDSEEENEEDLHNAIMEMVRTPDIDESPGTSRRHSEWQDPPEGGKRSKMSTRKVIPIEQAEQGSQTGENREKAKSSRPEHAKLESDDSWATLLIKRFTRAKDTKTVNVPPKSNIIKRDEANPTTNISLKDGTENIKSSTESSNESLVRTEHYGFSKSKTGKTKSSQNQISDGESGEESAEFLEKLRKIEEASKPKSWRRPKPIVIQPKQVSSTTKMKADEVEAKPHPDNEEKHKYINILKVPFHRNLIYAAENETINQPTFNQTPEDLDTRTSDPQIRPQKTEEMNAETPEKNSAEKTFENSEQKKHANSDSQRTLTITGHSHITTKWQDHCHFKDSQHTGVDKPARRKLIVACILCFIFMIVEIVGGVVSNSLAIATDAAHLLTDLASFLISLFALYLAGRPSSERLNFGWYRAEVIGAMISVFFIWVITGILVYMAIMRWVNQEFDLEAKIMLITSALAILFNIIMAGQLSHGHSHFTPGKFKRSEAVESQQMNEVDLGSQKDLLLMGRSVSAQLPVKGEQNINVRAALIHVIGDLIQSIGVFVAALIIYFEPKWAFMDSVCTFVFSVLVLVVTFKILKDVLMVLMEATPDYMDYEEVKRTFLSIPGVEHVHNLRIWALSINKIALSAHLAISKDADPQLILEEATKLIHKRYRFFESTIQIEEFSPDMKNCEQCKRPSVKTEDRRPTDLEGGVGGGDRKKDTENGLQIQNI